MASAPRRCALSMNRGWSAGTNRIERHSGTGARDSAGHERALIGLGAGAGAGQWIGQRDDVEPGRTTARVGAHDHRIVAGNHMRGRLGRLLQAIMPAQHVADVGDDRKRRTGGEIFEVVEPIPTPARSSRAVCGPAPPAAPAYARRPDAPTRPGAAPSHRRDTGHAIVEHQPDQPVDVFNAIGVAHHLLAHVASGGIGHLTLLQMEPGPGSRSRLPAWS